MNNSIGIIGAMPEELAGLLEALQNSKKLDQKAFDIFSGQLLDHDVLIAQSGVGKANAAALAQALIMLGASKIIFTGVAGAVSKDLEVGDIVVSTDCLQHDVDITSEPMSLPIGQIMWEDLSWQADTQLVDIAYTSASAISECKAIKGRVVSGDQFIADVEKVQWLEETFGAVCAEMEGAAVAQICHKNDVPFVIIRSISDNARQDAGMDFMEFTLLASVRAKTVVFSMLETL